MNGADDDPGADLTAEEVAAVVAVLAAVSRPREDPAAPGQSRWSSAQRMHRHPVHPTGDGWAAAARPS